MQTSLVSEGLNLMLTGMSTVLVFLALLVVLTTLASNLITRYFPEPVLEPATKAKPRVARNAVDPVTVQVITKAVAEHRKRKS